MFKNIHKIALGTFALSLALLGACERNDCPEVVRPEPIKLTTAQQERFPYEDFNTLTFLVEGVKGSETITLNKAESGKRNFVLVGSREESGVCPPSPLSIYEMQYVTFKSEGGDDEHTLTFKNKAFGSSISVHFNDLDSSGISHGFLDGLIGENNEIPWEDTVQFKNNVYHRATRGFNHENLPPTNYIFQIDMGFVHMLDNYKHQTWTLVEAK